MTAAGLLDRVAGDLDGCRLHPVHPALALVETADGPACWWVVRVDRRRLLVQHNSVFRLDGPPTSADVGVVLRHTGHVRRTGLGGRVRGRDRVAGEAMLERLLEGGELAEASLPLDFTRFEVRPVAGRWRVEVELMGGAVVRTRLPPSTQYVRLSADQVAGLLATVAVLHRRLPAEPALLRPTSERPSTEGGGHHLPRRTS